MIIRKAAEADLGVLMPIFEEARGTIAALGIDQWQNGYPSEAVIREDIRLGRSHLAEEEGMVCATFALLLDGEPTYDKIYEGHWLSGDDCRAYVAIHRVAISLCFRGSGIAGRILAFAAEQAAKQAFSALRIDTHEGNVVMRRMLEKNGFIHCGTIYLEDGSKRVAYERLL